MDEAILDHLERGTGITETPVTRTARPSDRANVSGSFFIHRSLGTP